MAHRCSVYIYLGCMLNRSSLMTSRMMVPSHKPSCHCPFHPDRCLPGRLGRIDLSSRLSEKASVNLLIKNTAARRLQLAGHCVRHPELPASRVILWEPSHGRMNPGRPSKTMVKTLKYDCDAETTEELRTLMEAREVWKVRHRARRRPSWPESTQ